MTKPKKTAGGKLPWGSREPYPRKAAKVAQKATTGTRRKKTGR